MSSLYIMVPATVHLLLLDLKCSLRLVVLIGTEKNRTEIGWHRRSALFYLVRHPNLNILITLTWTHFLFIFCFRFCCVAQECLFASWPLTIYWGYCSAFYDDTEWGRWPQPCTPVCLMRSFQPAQRTCISSKCSAVHIVQSAASKPARVAFIAGSWFGAYEINKQVILEDEQGSCQLGAILLSAHTKSFWHGREELPFAQSWGSTGACEIVLCLGLRAFGPPGVWSFCKKKNSVVVILVGSVWAAQWDWCCPQGCPSVWNKTCLEEMWAWPILRRLRGLSLHLLCTNDWRDGVSACSLVALQLVG